MSNENKLSIEANKVVVENLQDYSRGENIGANVGGIGLNNKAPIGQTGVQYGSHDKEQNSNATFVNTEVTEAGKKLNLEEMGINTDISKAQVITKDEVVEQIDTNLHTDLLNTTTRKQLADDVKKAGEGLKDIGASLSSDKQRYEEAREGRYSQYYKEQNPEFADFLKNPDKKSPEEMEQLTKDYVKYMTGKDVDVIITATGEGSGYIRGDQLGEGKKDVFVWDLKELEAGGDVSEIIGHEVNHVDDHRRDRESHNETDSNSLGGRFKENLGEDGVRNGFDLDNWLNEGNNSKYIDKGLEKLNDEYEGYELEGYSKNKCVSMATPDCQKSFLPPSIYDPISKNIAGEFAPFKGLGDNLTEALKESGNSKKKVYKPSKKPTTNINKGDKPRSEKEIHKIVTQEAINQDKVPEMYSSEVAGYYRDHMEGNTGEYLDTKSLIGTKISQREYDDYMSYSNLIRYTEEYGNVLGPVIALGMGLKLSNSSNKPSKVGEVEVLSKDFKLPDNIRDVTPNKGLTVNSQGKITYKPEIVNPNQVLVSNPITGEIVINQVGKTGLKPTVLPSYNAKITSNKVGNLPLNVQNTFIEYQKINWVGNFPGQNNGTKAGGTFSNNGAPLPTHDLKGKKIEYKEYDVNNKVQGQRRDSERFVVGNDGSVYYTNDHYKTFTKIK